jgi:hypothetical protein
MRYLPTRRQFVASFLAGSGMASAFAREWALCGPETARARYESFVASLRTARSLDLVADVVTSQKVQGGRMPISSSIEARLARPGRGILHRERRGLVGTPESSPIVTEVLGDGDISYQVDPAAESYVRSWPPRFLAAGEGRGILPLREFLEEPSDPPRAIRFEKHPNKTDLTGLRLDYDDRAETLFFDGSLALKAIIKEETTGFETMRTHFDVREFRLGTAEPGAEYIRKPIADYRDMTK